MSKFLVSKKMLVQNCSWLKKPVEIDLVGSIQQKLLQVRLESSSSDFPLPLPKSVVLCQRLQEEESRLHEKQSGHQSPAQVWERELACHASCETPVQPPVSSITSRRIICESLKNLGGGMRPSLVVTLFSMCHFNTSDQRKYLPPDSIPPLWICTDHHSYKVHCKTSCACICMLFLQNMPFLLHNATNDLPKAMCSEAMGLLSLTKV